MTDSKPSVAFIGTGIMGAPIAGHILDAGYPLTVYNRTKAKADDLVARGAVWAASPAEAAAGADVVFTMVGYPEDVEELYLAKDGLLASSKPGATLIDLTTSSPDLARDISKLAEVSERHAFDCPVTGGESGAVAGTLTLICGATEEQVEPLRPLLETFGAQIFCFGEAGQGQAAKLCNQVALASSMVGMADTLALAEQSGLDVDLTLKMIQGGTGRRMPPAGAGAAPAPAPSGLFADLTGRYDAGILALMVAAAALVICLGLGLSPLVAVVIVLLSFVTTIMSAQSVGSTGIDPMEIFGLIVLLIVAVISDTAPVKLFFVAGIVAVTCGLAGDVMSDFKTGALIGTNPRAMWAGQAVGALLGVVVAVLTMNALFAAYGPDAFGVGKAFVAAQASVVATMVSGIPSVPAFALGLAAGIGLYLVGLPSMMIGLGVYLPFYMPLSMFLGAFAKVVFDRFARRAGVDEQAEQETGIVVASGLLGGESIVGVIIALASVVAGLAG